MRAQGGLQTVKVGLKNATKSLLRQKLDDNYSATPTPVLLTIAIASLLVVHLTHHQRTPRTLSMLYLHE